VIRSHASLLKLIRDYGESGAVEQLAEIDKTLFDLFDTLTRVKVVANIGALDGCRLCDEALEIIRGELGSDPGGDA
jgi:hypothetical protein